MDTNQTLRCDYCGRFTSQEHSRIIFGPDSAFGSEVAGWTPARQHHPLLDGIRKSINDCFGGMGPGSSIWGSTQYDKGFCAGVLAALTAFDTERKKGEL